MDRFNLPRKDFSKVSLGAEKTIPWEQTKTLAAAVHNSKKKASISWRSNKTKVILPYSIFKGPKDKPLALVLGNEVRGVSKQSLKLVDAIVEIPMRGKKESLNVSVAAGIALFVLTHKTL